MWVAGDAMRRAAAASACEPATLRVGVLRRPRADLERWRMRHVGAESGYKKMVAATVQKNRSGILYAPKAAEWPVRACQIKGRGTCCRWFAPRASLLSL